MTEELSGLRQQALNAVQRTYFSLILFGSFARGDASDDSDIDVLQIVDEPFPSYAHGRLSFSVYSLGQLRRMARASSLFILHILTEAVPLEDSIDALSILRREFVEPAQVSDLLEEVRVAADLLDVSEGEYLGRWRKFNSLALNLLRTTVYATLWTRRQLTFSMKLAAEKLADERLLDALRLRNSVRAEWTLFVETRNCLMEHTSHEIRNRHGSIEALIANSYGMRTLAVVLGLRLLNDTAAPIRYENFDDPTGQG